MHVQEVVVKVVYQPAMGQPRESAGIPTPDWVGAAAGVEGFYLTGGYDGFVRLYVVLAPSPTHACMHAATPPTVHHHAAGRQLRLHGVMGRVAHQGHPRPIVCRVFVPHSRLGVLSLRSRFR